MENKLIDILDILSETAYQTSFDLAERLRVSEKTVRVRMKELADELRRHGADIESKPRLGFRLVVTGPELYRKFASVQLADKKGRIPSTSGERIDFLLAYLLCHDGYIKMDELSELLFISKNTLAGDMKKVEQYLEQYKVQIIRKPNHGIAIMGAEFDIRLCIANYVVKRGFIPGIGLNFTIGEQLKISEIVLPVIRELNIPLSELSTQSLVIHIYTALKRMKHNIYIPYSEPMHRRLEEKMNLAFTGAGRIAAALYAENGVEFPLSEIDYIAIHLAGKRIVGNFDKEEPNLLISQDIYDLSCEMLETVYQIFKIDLRGDFELKMTICEHLVPLDIRLNYGMILKNPLLETIRERYPFGFTVASQAVIPINRRYGTAVGEDEVGYFAALFALALESGNRVKKKNILLVCATGKSSAMLLASRYEQEFGQYINQIKVVALRSLPQVDFTGIDYVLSTIPLREKIPVPILEIKMLFEDEGVISLKKAFGSVDKEFLLGFYQEALFFTDIEAGDMKEVISFLCRKISQVMEVPADFEQAVWNREMLAPTDFGNFIALPHPYGAVTRESFVCVGILKKPILWSKHEVQLVFLISLSDKENPDIQKFYRQTTGLAQNRARVKRVIEQKDFDYLIEQISEMAYEGRA